MGMQTRRDSGFTLIELMIVAAIISVVAGVAVPNLLSSRAIANERAVLAAMRTIATAQVQCQSRAVVDIDGDGRGELLGLACLTGQRTLRGTSESLVPAYLPASLGNVDVNGFSQGRGYLLALYLPDSAGNGLADIAANEGSIDADQAEISWSCIAWPVTLGRTGNGAFFVNQTGEILVAKNATYNGTLSVPPAGAALVGVPATTIVGGQIAAGTLGADGNMWQLVR